MLTGVLMAPATAAFAPQKMVAGASQGVKSDPASALQNGLGAAQKAKEIAKKGNQRAADANEIMSDAPVKGDASQALVDSLADPNFIVQAYKSDPQRAAKDFPGTPVQVHGIVARADSSGPRTVVTILPTSGVAKGQPFLFRFPDNTQVFEEGRTISLEGVFVMRMSMDTGETVYLVDVQGAVNPGSGTAGAEVPPAEVPADFNAGFHGWRFAGSVADGEKGTGVFIREGETVYARPGDVLPGGVRVRAIKAGEAHLSIAGQTSVATPW